MTHTIEISTDIQICSQCGKKGKDFYKNKQGTYICNKCVLKNIETLRGKKTQ